MDPLPGPEVGSSISEIAQQCREALQTCLRIPDLMRQEWAENRLAEFKLWAAGTGAFAGEKASLDSRLAMEFDTKNLVMNILILLLTCIRECQDSALLGRTPVPDVEDPGEQEFSESPPGQSLDQDDPVPRAFSPWSDMSSDEESDDDPSLLGPDDDVDPQLASAKDEVEKVLNHLSRLAMAIRKSGSSWRAQKADRRFRPDDHHELRTHLVLLILARGSRDGRESYEVDDAALTPIHQRLVMANLRRRNRFIVAQSHARKLAFEAPRDQTAFGLPALNDMAPFLFTESEAAPTIRSVATIERPPIQVDVPTQPIGVAAWTATSASHVATQIPSVPQQIPTPSQVAKTNITSTAAKVVYPKPPRAKDGLRYFSCPCCCQILPEMFRQVTLWKKHLMEDVCPYTCIIEECSKPDTLYMTRSAWMKHVKEDHQKCWECSPCSVPGKAPRIFASIEAFLEHLRAHHADSINEAQYATLTVDATKAIPAGISRCPLCDETNIADADPLFDHIAEHLHSFALRALPWPSDEFEDAEIQDRDYFKDGGFFDDGDGDQSNQYNIFSDSDRDSEGLASLPSNATDHEQPERGEEREGTDGRQMLIQQLKTLSDTFGEEYHRDTVSYDLKQDIYDTHSTLRQLQVRLHVTSELDGEQRISLQQFIGDCNAAAELLVEHVAQGSDSAVTEEKMMGYLETLRKTIGQYLSLIPEIPHLLSERTSQQHSDETYEADTAKTVVSFSTCEPQNLGHNPGDIFIIEADSEDWRWLTLWTKNKSAAEAAAELRFPQEYQELTSTGPRPPMLPNLTPNLRPNLDFYKRLEVSGSLAVIKAQERAALDTHKEVIANIPPGFRNLEHFPSLTIVPDAEGVRDQFLKLLDPKHHRLFQHKPPYPLISTMPIPPSRPRREEYPEGRLDMTPEARLEERKLSKRLRSLFQTR